MILDGEISAMKPLINLGYCRAALSVVAITLDGAAHLLNDSRYAAEK